MSVIADWSTRIELTLKINGGLDWSSLDDSDDGPEYHIVLHTGPSFGSPTITYHASKFYGKSRNMTRFESQQLLKCLRSLKLKIPDDGNEIVNTNRPMPWCQLIIKYENTTLDMSWLSDDYYDDEEPLCTSSALVRLIQEIEPIDQTG